MPLAPVLAWCRTTTVHNAGGYDPTRNGCWTSGIPLAWTPGSVGYSISAAASRQVPLDEATRVAHLAFSSWSEAPCARTRPALKTYDAGPVTLEAGATDCGLNACDSNVHDGRHVVVFRDDVWPHNDPNNTLALTTVTYGIDTGAIYDADIEINTHDHKVTAQEPPPSGSFDLRSILTHEAGHFLGLAHSQYTDAVMFAHYQQGLSTLTTDDIDAVCSIYDAPARGCACASGHAQSGADAAMALAIGVLAAGALRRLAGRARSRRPRLS